MAAAKRIMTRGRIILCRNINNILSHSVSNIHPHLHHNLPVLHLPVPQCQEAHQEPCHGASQMSHVADVPFVLPLQCAGENPVVDGPADVPQDEEGDHQHLQCSQSLPVNSVDRHSSVQMRPEIQEDWR